MSFSLNSSKGVYRGLYRRLLLRILRGILGVSTMAHVRFGEGRLGFKLDPISPLNPLYG